MPSVHDNILRFNCNNCGKTLKVDRKHVGKSLPCPVCQKPVLITEMTDPEPVDIKIVTKEPSTEGDLIPCGMCGATIAKTANACPTCGAPNRWIHPQVERFIENAQQFRTPAEFQYQCDRETVSGRAMVQRGSFHLGSKLLIAGILLTAIGGATRLGPIAIGIGGPMALIGLVMSAVGAMSPMKESDTVVRFSIDFSGPTHVWRSTDDEFFGAIKRFYKL